MRDAPTAISFVKLVEKHPCLWNYTLVDYNKREATDLAWKAIAKKMGDSELNCRDRWKNVRCSFVRSYNNPKAKTRYYLADQLAFLVPYTKGKLNSDNTSVDNDDKTDDTLEKCVETAPAKTKERDTEDSVDERFASSDDVEHHDESILSPSSHTVERERRTRKGKFITKEGDTEDTVVERFASSDDVEHHDESIPSPSSHTVERERRTRKRKFMMQIAVPTKVDSELKRVHSTVKKPLVNDNDDTDLLFFKSLIPDVKNLSDKKKRNFRKKIMTILDDLIEEQ